MTYNSELQTDDLNLPTEDQFKQREKIKDKDKPWMLSVLVAIDQLGNAFAGGNPDATVSARVGYFNAKPAEQTGVKYPKYWQQLERIIDATFYPLDGPRHCYFSYKEDQYERFQRGNDGFRAMLGVIVIGFCGLAYLPIRALVKVVPSLSYENRT